MSDMQNNGQNNTRNDEVQKNILKEKKSSQSSENLSVTKKRRSAVSIMGSLMGLVKPLLHIMIAAIILGTAGYLCAIFLTILAGQVIVHGILTGEMGAAIATETTDVALSAQTVGITVRNLWLINTPVKTIIIIMIIIAVLRGILHYAEQYCNCLLYTSDAADEMRTV